MKLNMKWQHNVLGLEEVTAEKLNKARNNIITMTAYYVYSTWVKCGFKGKFQVSKFEK